MAHYKICILVTNDENLNDEQLLEKATAAANNFDTELEVPPYKRYLQQEDIERIKKHYKLASSEEIVPKLQEWYGEAGAIDEGGVYVISTQNPKGQFDYGDILGKVPQEEWQNIFLKENLCKAAITPNGEWVEGPTVYADNNLETKKVLDKWEDSLLQILEENKGAAAFLADLHI